MSMDVKVSVNGTDITSLHITNVTAGGPDPDAINTYRWTYSRHDLGALNALMSTQEGALEHRYGDGAMALIAKVAQAASETEVDPDGEANR